MIEKRQGSRRQQKLKDKQKAQKKAQQQEQKQENYDVIKILKNQDNHTDVTCDVCLDQENENGNLLIICDFCFVAVHQNCYGSPLVGIVPGYEDEWFCDRCEAIKTQKKTISELSCFLCVDLQGAIKNVGTKMWAHISCVNWIPEIWFREETDKNTIGGDMSKTRYKLKCDYCNNSKGACIQCDSDQCEKSWHVRCAMKSGIIQNWPEMLSKFDQLTQMDEFVPLFCEDHMDKKKLEVRYSIIAQNGGNNMSPSPYQVKRVKYTDADAAFKTLQNELQNKMQEQKILKQENSMGFGEKLVHNIQMQQQKNQKIVNEQQLNKQDQKHIQQISNPQIQSKEQIEPITTNQNIKPQIKPPVIESDDKMHLNNRPQNQIKQVAKALEAQHPFKNQLFQDHKMLSSAISESLPAANPIIVNQKSREQPKLQKDQIFQDICQPNFQAKIKDDPEPVVYEQKQPDYQDQDQNVLDTLQNLITQTEITIQNSKAKTKSKIDHIWQQIRDKKAMYQKVLKEIQNKITILDSAAQNQVTTAQNSLKDEIEQLQDKKQKFVQTIERIKDKKEQYYKERQEALKIINTNQWIKTEASKPPAQQHLQCKQVESQPFKQQNH